MDADSIDAIVTDPPYGLEFMGKEWDRLPDVPGDHAAVPSPWSCEARCEWAPVATVALSAHPCRLPDDHAA